MGGSRPALAALRRGIKISVNQCVMTSYCHRAIYRLFLLYMFAHPRQFNALREQRWMQHHDSHKIVAQAPPYKEHLPPGFKAITCFRGLAIKFTSSHDGANSEALHAKASATADRAKRGNTLSISTRHRSGYRHASPRIGDQRPVSPHRASSSMSHNNGIRPFCPLAKTWGRGAYGEKVGFRRGNSRKWFGTMKTAKHIKSIPASIHRGNTIHRCKDEAGNHYTA